MPDPRPSHYFDERPSATHRMRTVHLTLPDVALALQSDTGVFAAAAVDPGTVQLLRAVPDPPATGSLLDLGCGYGPIALTLAHRAPAASVWAIDVNERARSLCASNAAKTHAANVTVCAPDDVPADLHFAGIWSNPPIRLGKEALHLLLRRWLPRLAPGAHAYLVVHKHLGGDSLQRWLTEQGWPTERIASRKGYRILDVSAREPDR